MTLVQKLAPNGLSFDTIPIGQFPMTLALSDRAPEITVHPDEKISVVMEWSFDLHKNSYKYSPEMVLSGWTSRFPEVKPRSLTGDFTRSETMFPIRRFYDSAMELLPELHSRLNGVK